MNELENENWTQKISSYYKIKVGTAQVEHLMQQAGFEVGLVNINRGMITMIGRKN